MREGIEGKRQEFQGPSPFALQHQGIRQERRNQLVEAEKGQAVRWEETDRMLCPGCQLHKVLPGGKNDE